MLRSFIICMLTASMASAQTEITWKTLGDVKFTDKYSEEVEAYYYYPHFGPTVKDLDGQEVYIKGYMLPINPKENIYILSKYPYASCFFCGNGGPESIVELKLRPDHPKFRMDQIVTIKGRLKLNRDDIYQCNYILEDATVY
ncbi:hypothetical protein C900_05099 [Fulvivirga imtechensis AK7]|uniref:DUF3299 domain-containing protein n=1 Tax=Fulvivirga imtechensis AK7 TaxID=1237149 RepID=L8JPG8_9BACT|nr:DUF3299 domain-containing protein [Fulvivirga imtechensis]ELR69409.1 hypothetical protein C900_05099 [Fulvivirga imtechensis AK7]